MLATSLGGRFKRYAFAKGQKTLVIDNVSRVPVLAAFLNKVVTPFRVSSTAVNTTVIGAAQFGTMGMALTSLTTTLPVAQGTTTTTLLGSMQLGITQMAATTASTVDAQVPTELTWHYYPSVKKVAVLLPYDDDGYVLISS